MRIQYNFEGDAFADGAGGDKFLIDLSEEMSNIYGRLVPQGQVFRVRGIDVRVYNPDTLVQDQTISVSGKLLYFHPTHHRKAAWRVARDTWVANRKALGVTGRGQAFRVGFGDDYSTDTGAFTDGVKFNAWINSADDPLMLYAASTDQDIFGNYSQNRQILSPDPTQYSFGHWAQKDADTLLEELDFTTHEDQYYYVGRASPTAQTVPFMVNFSSWFDDSQADPSDFGSATNAQHCRGPLDVMCGLLAVYVDTTAVDDSESQTQDWGLEIIVDVESWSPIDRRRSKKKKQLKGGKK